LQPVSASAAASVNSGIARAGSIPGAVAREKLARARAKQSPGASSPHWARYSARW
jgi:hypothetical protein